MAETSIFWTTGALGDGAAAYTMAKTIDWVHRTLGEGVHLGYLNALECVSAAPDVTVDTGAAVVWGFPYDNSASVSVTPPIPVGDTRIDRIVLRADWAAQTVRITRIEGIEGGAAPAITQTYGTTWDLKLCQLSITVGGVIVVTDERVYCQYLTEVDTAMIQALAVTGAKIAAATITQSKMATDSVGTLQIIGGSVTEGKITALNVTEGKIAAGAVTEAKIGALAVTAAKLAADAVETAKIKDLNVTEGKLAAGAVTVDKIGALAVTAAKLAADAVETAKIKDLNVTEGKIAALAVTEGKIGALAVTAAKLAADAVETAKIKDLNVTAGKLAADAVTTAKILNANVTEAKLATPYGRGAFVWTMGGEQATGTNVGVEYTAPWALTLTGGYIQCKTAPTGASLIFDVHSGAGAGTTVFTTQPNRPTLAATATGPTAIVAPDVTAIPAGTRMTLDCDQIGSTLPGEDVTVILAYKYSLSA